MGQRTENCKLLALPAEIRIAILEYVFADNLNHDGFKERGRFGGILLDENYRASASLQPLLTCKQFYREGNILALNWTHFVATSFSIANNIPERLAILRPKQIEVIRSLAFEADAALVRKLIDSGTHPFGIPQLSLDTLTIVPYRLSLSHYLTDFTSSLVHLLRNLHGVRRLTVVRNDAHVRRTFKTWYNRVIGLVMKVDHRERYEKTPPNPESVWWKWSYDGMAQSFCLEAVPPKEWVDEETYMRQMRPLMEELKVSIENEEWDPDPRGCNRF